MSNRVIEAASVIMPLVTAFMAEAERTGQPGPQKREAVALAVERAYKNLQATRSVKEINDVPWELVAPIVSPAAGGLISLLASMFNKLWGKIWRWADRTGA